MAERVKLTVLSNETVERRTAAGLIVPMHAGGGLEVVDCVEKRPVTTDFNKLRTAHYGKKIVPGRFAGSAPGFALTALGTICAQSKNGSEIVRQFLGDFNGEGVADLSGTIATQLHAKGKEVNLHSDTTKEGSATIFAHPHEGNATVGCGLATFFGKVLVLGASKDALQEATAVARKSGMETSAIERAHSGIRTLSNHFDASATIHRGAVHYTQTELGHHLPTPIVDDQRKTSGTAQFIYDMTGYRSDAGAHYDAGMPRYHHTPSLAPSLLPEALPTFDFSDEDLMTGVAIVLAAGTRAVLEQAGGHELAAEIIAPAASAA